MRSIPVDPEFLGCAHDNGAFDPRGPRVLIHFVDGREDGEEPHPQACTFSMTRAQAAELAKKILENT